MNLLKQIEEKGAMIMPAKLADINYAEKQLNIEFSNEYKKYLEQCGVLSYGSHEIYGLGIPEDNYLNILTVCKDVASQDVSLPKDCVPLEDIMDAQYYLYDNNNHQIYIWSAATGQILETVSKTLNEFLEDVLNS